MLADLPALLGFANEDLMVALSPDLFPFEHDTDAEWRAGAALTLGAMTGGDNAGFPYRLHS
jgi:hypothetical protein